MGILVFVLNSGKHYSSIIPELRWGLERANATAIIDLCSGAGGPWKSLSRSLSDQNVQANVVLTDLFPNLASFQRVSEQCKNVEYEEGPVDATAVPARLNGFRTMFTSFHHFRPEQGQAILNDAVRNRCGIGIFEFTYRMNWFLLLLSIIPTIIGTALLMWVIVPFVRPFRWANLFWTYLVPFAFLFAAWDGCVSCMRTYSTRELLDMAMTAGGEDYEWKAGTKWVPVSSMPVTYLVGVPKK